MVWLFEMANMYFHQILSYIGSIYYHLTNQLMIVDIDNYHVCFLYSAIYTNKRINNSLCYDFTYNQRPWSQIFLWMNYDHPTYPLLNVQIPVQVQYYVFCICQVISFTLNINVINGCDNTQYIQMISVSGFLTQGNEHFYHLFMLYLKYTGTCYSNFSCSLKFTVLTKIISLLV